MATTAKRKEYPISMRLPDADVTMIDRAANLRGRSRTDFVRDAAVRAAEEVVMEQGLIRMSPEGFAEFMDVLARPAAPVPESVEVLKRPTPRESGWVAKRYAPAPVGSRTTHRRSRCVRVLGWQSDS